MARIAPTARLANIKAPLSQRKILAEAKTYAAFSEIKDVFMKKNEITSSHLHAILKKQSGGVKFRICQLTDSPDQGECKFVYKNDVLKSFDIMFQMSKSKGKSVIKSDQMDTVMHEIRHFFDYITQPKMAARQNNEALWKNDLGYQERVPDYDDFFEEILYKNEYTHSKTSENPIKEREENLKKRFEKLFENTPSMEKIEVLQNYRHSLMTEQNAFQSGIKLSGEYNLELGTKHSKDVEGIEDYKALEMKEIQKTADSTTEDYYFFGEKIKLIENLLAGEIQLVRAEQLKTAKKIITVVS